EETQKTSPLRRSRLAHLRPLKPPAGELESTQSSSGIPSVPSFTPTFMHPAGSKRKNFDAYDKHRARGKMQKAPAGQKAQTVMPGAPSIPDSSSKLSPWSLTPSCSSTLPLPKHDRGRNSSISSDSGGLVGSTDTEEDFVEFALSKGPQLYTKGSSIGCLDDSLSLASFQQLLAKQKQLGVPLTRR
ncbi:hypothetical protein BGZ46_006055, partial [Entomortierella lignicola]